MHDIHSVAGSRTCVIRLLGALFLPCALVSDVVCDLCCHKCGQWPRAVQLINRLRWPLSYACTASVLTYSGLTSARPPSTGVCVCVCRHEMWVSGFPAQAEVIFSPLSNLSSWALCLVVYECVSIGTSGLLELGFRSARLLGQNLLTGCIVVAIIHIVRCRP